MNSDKNSSLLIVGCGWVGKKLGEKLSSEGFSVYGTTRSSDNFPDIQSHNIQPVQLELPAESTSEISFPETASVLISVSPGKRGGREKYANIIGQLSQVLAQRNVQVIMYSSTSAYGNSKNIMTEEDAVPDSESDNHILAAEGKLRESCPESVILRLAGLYGTDRHPAKYMAGRTDISNGDAPANLVHREDVIQATQLIIEENVRGEIFNVCSPVRPTRKEVYTTICQRLNMDVPTFLAGGEDEKSISPKKLVNRFSMEFIHPDPTKFMAD